MTMMPVKLADALRKQIASVAELHREDLSAGAGEVNLPRSAGSQIPKCGARAWLAIFVSGVTT